MIQLQTIGLTRYSIFIGEFGGADHCVGHMKILSFVQMRFFLFIPAFNFLDWANFYFNNLGNEFCLSSSIHLLDAIGKEMF